MKSKRGRILFSLAVLLSLGIAEGLQAQQANQAEIQRYSRQAEEAIAEKNLDDAVQALQKLAQLTPNSAEVHGNLGMVYYTQGRFAQAAEAFQRALKLNVRMTRARLMLGICFAELGRNKEAVPLLEPAFRLPPDREIGRLIGLELQRAYTGLKQYGKANAVSADLLNRYPNDPEILYHASRLHADLALQSMMRLLEVAPDSVWVRQSFAEVHETQKHYDLAIAEYRAVLKMEPRRPSIHFRLGRAMLLSSKDEKVRDEALREFEQELAIDPQNSDAEYEIGEVYRERGQLEWARDHLSKAVFHHPEFEEAQIALARALMNLGKPQEALPHLLAAVRVNPANEVSHFQLAAVYKALGDAASHRKEMALFQKFHVRPYSAGLPLPQELAVPQVTRQTLDSDVPPQP